MKTLLAILLLASTALAQPMPPGGGYGVFTPAGPHNLAGGKLYGDQADDSDTYIWRTGANEWTVVAGGNNSLVMDATGVTLGAGWVYATGTIADGDATPSMSGANVWTTSSNTGATVITDLDDPAVAAMYILIGGSNTNASTIADSGNFNLDPKYGGMTLTVDAWIMIYVQADNDYIEMGRGDNVSTDAISVPASNGLTVGTSVPFSDSSGTLTLQNIDALGSTTETTVEGAIDTLANLTSIQGQSVTIAGTVSVESGGLVANQDLTTDANVGFTQVTVGNTGLVVGTSTPFSDSSGTLTLQNIDALEATTESTIELAIDTLTLSSLTMSGDPDIAANDIKNVDDFIHDAVATDAAPRITVLTSQPVNTAPVLTNTTGANLVLVASPGERVLEGVTKGNTAGDTFTVTTYTNGVAAVTVLTADTEWVCSGADTDIICVCNLWDYIAANPITGVTMARTDGACSDEKLSFNLTPGAAEYLTVVSSDDTNMDMTSGTSGQVLVPGGVHLALDGGSFLPDVDDINTVIRSAGADYLRISVGNVDINIIEDADDRVDFSGFRLTSATDQLNLGGACTDGHSQGAGDVCVGTGTLQVNGQVWFGASLTMGGGIIMPSNQPVGTTPSLYGGYYPRNTGMTPNASTLTVGTTSRILYLMDDGDKAVAMNLAQQDDPTLVWQSNSVTPAKRGWINHDESNFNYHVETGAHSFFFPAGKGQSTNTAATVETVTFAGNPGDASATSVGTIIADGDNVSHVTGRVVTAGTNCASFSVGDGVDADLWGAAIAVTDATTFGSSAATATWNRPALANQEITVTANGGNCYDMVVALTVHRVTATPASSD